MNEAENTLTSNNKSGNVESSDCQFVSSSKRATPVPKHGRFVLDEQDITTIESSEWLTDHIIGAAHSTSKKTASQAEPSPMADTTAQLPTNRNVSNSQYQQAKSEVSEQPVSPSVPKQQLSKVQSQSFPCKVVCGSMSEQSEEFPLANRGNQCTSMSLTFLLHSTTTSFGALTKEAVDAVLRVGDRVHTALSNAVGHAAARLF